MSFEIGTCNCGCSASFSNPVRGHSGPGNTPTVWAQCEYEHGAVGCPVSGEEFAIATNMGGDIDRAIMDLKNSDEKRAKDATSEQRRKLASEILDAAARYPHRRVTIIHGKWQRLGYTVKEIIGRADDDQLAQIHAAVC